MCACLLGASWQRLQHEPAADVSCRLPGAGENFEVQERLGLPGIITALIATFIINLIFVLLAIGPFRRFAQKRLFLKPGQGPSRKGMLAGTHPSHDVLSYRS